MRHRPSALLIAVALYLGCDGETPALDCGSQEGEASDHCWAERAADTSLDTQARHQAAQRVQDATLRDLALSTVAPSLGVDACDTIHDTMLRRSCQARARRPHLDIPEPDRAPRALPGPALTVQDAQERAAHTRAQEACEPLPDALRGPCYKRHVDLEPATLCWVPCTLIEDGDARGDCASHAATRIGVAERPELAAALCGSLEDARWRGECNFRASEALPLSRLGDALDACERALGFEDECRRHLVQRQAQAAALRARFGDAGETLQGMSGDADALLHALGAQPEAAWLQRLYHYEAFHALLAEALQQRRLEAVIAAGGAALDEGDPRRGPWRDVAGKLCAYDAARAGELTDLDSLRDRVRACAFAPVPAEALATLLPSQGPRSRFGELTTSEVPAPIQVGAPCAMTADTRALNAALWGIEQLPWSASEALVREALVHPEPTVRAYAMDMAEHKAFFWHRDDREARARLAARLAQLAQDDPSAPIRARAAVMAEALAAGTRPARWAFHSTDVCAATPPTPGRDAP